MNNIEYYLREFAEIREERFASFKEEPYNDFLNKDADFFQNVFLKEGYLDDLTVEDVEEIVKHFYFYRLIQEKAPNLIQSLIHYYRNNEDKLLLLGQTFKILVGKINGENKFHDIGERLKKVFPDAERRTYKNSKLLFWDNIVPLSEIISQCFPNDFVFYSNENKEVLKFLKIIVFRERRNYIQSIIRGYVFYQKTLEKELTPLYKKIVWNKVKGERHAICLEVNLFLNWIYETYIKEKSNQLTNGKEAQSVLYSNLGHISIKNYFSLENINIEGINNSKEIYILGENGVGKTLFLQAITLATKWHTAQENDPETAGVFEKHAQNKENKDLEIIVGGSDFAKKEKYQVSLTQFILSNKKTNKKEHEFITPAYLKNIFAYGIHRDISEKKGHEYLSLFGKKGLLINPINWLIDLYNLELAIAAKKEKEKPHIPLDVVVGFLKKILEDKIDIKVSYNNVLFTEDGTKSRDLNQLSDGYQSVLVWVIDMISRFARNQPNARELKDFVGVVLIDELDLYLHVKWAQNIVSKLRTWFENVQFIITTHSPILALGASEDAVFYKLYKEDGVTKISEPMRNISDLMLNSLVTSPLFGLDSAHTRGFEEIKNEGSSDYIYYQIHKVISERLQKNPGVTNEDTIMDWVDAELEKELGKLNQ